MTLSAPKTTEGRMSKLLVWICFVISTALIGYGFYHAYIQSILSLFFLFAGLLMYIVTIKNAIEHDEFCVDCESEGIK